MRKTHGCPVQHSHPDDWPLTGYSLGLLTAANDLYILYIIEHLYQSKGRSNPLYIKYAQCGSSNAHYMNDGFMYYMPMPRSKNIYYSGGHAPCRIFFLFTFFPAASVNIENPAPAPPPPPRWKKIKAELWWIIPERGGLIGNTASVRPPPPSPASLPNWVNIILYNNSKTETSYFFLILLTSISNFHAAVLPDKVFFIQHPWFQFYFFIF